MAAPSTAVAFANPARLRAWLRKHGTTRPELFVRCSKVGHEELGVTYRQALDEALCFGWIDGVRHGIDATSFSVRFTPRKAGSAWSQVNLRRAAELQAEGRMEAAGRAALEARTTPAYSYESKPQDLDPEFLRRLRESRTGWRFFESQPPGYRRIVAFWVMSAKRPQTRERRFAILLRSSEAGQRIPLLRRDG